jgi:hypothetical protein
MSCIARFDQTPSQDLALEVSPESVSARRASMHTSRSGLLGGSHSGSEVSLLTQQLQQVKPEQRHEHAPVTSGQRPDSKAAGSMMRMQQQTRLIAWPDGELRVIHVCSLCMQGVRLGAEEYAALLRSKWFKHQDGKVPGYHGATHIWCGALSFASLAAGCALLVALHIDA